MTSKPDFLAGRLGLVAVFLLLVLALPLAPQVDAAPQPAYSLSVSPSEPLDCRGTATFNLRLIDGRNNQAHSVQFEVRKPRGTGSSQTSLVIGADQQGTGSATVQYPSPSFTPISGTVATDITGVYTVMVTQTEPINVGTVATAQFSVSCHLTVAVAHPLPNTVVERGSIATITATVSDVTGPVNAATVTANTPSGRELLLSATGPGLYSADYWVLVNEPVGPWNIVVQAVDPLGNSGTSMPVPASVVGSLLIVYELVAYNSENVPAKDFEAGDTVYAFFRLRYSSGDILTTGQYPVSVVNPSGMTVATLTAVYDAGGSGFHTPEGFSIPSSGPGGAWSVAIGPGSLDDGFGNTGPGVLTSAGADVVQVITIPGVVATIKLPLGLIPYLAGGLLVLLGGGIVVRRYFISPESSPQILHRIFETQADARPGAVAVVFGPVEVTYADLENRANRLARHLRRKGVARGDAVAMLLPRSVDAYATLLGVLKAGAAYVPVDPAYPRDRVAYILRDSGAKVLVTTEELASHPSFTGPIIRVDADHAAISAESPVRVTEVQVDPRDLCYVVYTSGSTGRPKGVMVEHGNVSHLVLAEGRIFEVQPEDRVYQGASLSFDLSVEEIWLAFNAGATLVAATPEMARAGPDLSKLLTKGNVTVLSCVPTLLSILGESVPTLRLLILGGEACPRQLVEHWSRPGLRMVNTYGPTETTVIATYADLSPGKNVTIGRPVPGYRVHILDEKLQPVPLGEIGEICIGGAGVARGYIGLSEQTRTHFVPDPFSPSDEPDARLYRTGDLGKFDAEGNVEFLGRVDGQVKLRGFRVELSEVETALMQADGVEGAACTLREDTPGLQQLVGYVVLRHGAQVDEVRLLSHLRSKLPVYMIPSRIDSIAELPMLPSGKLDRASLPPPRPKEEAQGTSAQRARTETERRLAEVWQALFHPLPVSVHDDFFLDLGGHSLLVAQMVSELRKDPRYARVSVSDVYEHPTLASLASHLDSSEAGPNPSTIGLSQSDTVRGDRPGDGRRHFLAGVLQSLGLFFIFGTRCLEWVTPYLVFFILLESGYSVLVSATWAMVSAVSVIPLLLVIAVATKWIVLGRVKPGRYRLWGGYYLRWWFAQSIVGVLPLRQLSGTPLLSAVYRLLGARIGKNVFLGTDRLGAYDLISIGDGASIDELVSVGGYSVENGELSIGPVTVGRGCFVGTWSVLSEYSVMEDEARLEDLSLLPRGARVPRGATWSGSPARPLNKSNPIPAPPSQGRIRSVATNMLYAMLIPVFPIIFFLAILPGMLFLAPIHLLKNPVPYLLAAPVVGASFVFLFTTTVVLSKWLLLGRVRAGTHPLHRGFYVRYWFVDQLLKLSLEVAGQLHATLYMAPWYKALGAKLGRSVELSTAASTTPDLIELGDGSTVADEVSLGAPRVEGGWMTLAPTRLGRRTFIGNSGVVPSGTSLGDESLVGVLSIAPSDSNEAARKGVSWLGSPPILLPRRQPSALFSDRRTFTPTRKLRLARGTFEILRITMPTAGFFLAASIVVAAALELLPLLGVITTLLMLPVIYATAVLSTIGALVLVKWIVIGRYKPFVRPLWNNFIWRLEFVNALYEFMATPIALEALQGTPFLPGYLRLLGCKIGRRAYIDTTGFLEWDLVEIGDRASLMEDCIMQTHLFEDRVLKASKLRVGRDCSIGPASVVLYDSTMEDGSRLDGLSLLMKGETLPGGTAWAGIPATWQGPSHLPAKEDEQQHLYVTAPHRRPPRE